MQGMYYVIQHRHNDPKKFFTAFVVPKFITSKNNENVIFEFNTADGKTKRKWTSKKEILLLTDNEEYFKKILARLTVTQNKHIAQVQHAEAHLQEELRELALAMQKEFEELEAEKDQDESACILKSYD